jgi:hypothetical protein
MFFPSLEVRWFVPGPLDEEGEIATRLRAIPFCAEAPNPEAGCLDPAAVGVPEWAPASVGAWREDTYLCLPGREDVGIKLRREGGDAPARIEFKGRTEEIGRIDGEAAPGEGAPGEGAPHGEAPDGRLERWAKWSARTDDVPLDLRHLLEPGGDPMLVKVRKRRLQRVLHLVDDGEAREVLDPERHIDRGVAIELARIEVEGAPAWSLGFEAFPDVAPSEIEPIVRRFVDALPRGALAAGTSCGYPGWLLRR